MLRLSMSTIELGSRDITDYDERKKLRGKNKTVQPLVEFFPVQSSRNRRTRTQGSSKDSLEEIEKKYNQDKDFTRLFLAGRPFSPASTHHINLQHCEGEEISGVTNDSEEDGYNQVPREASLENITLQPNRRQQQQQQRPISPSKDEFHYGGFNESPSQQAQDEDSQDCSTFRMFQGNSSPEAH